VLRYLYRLNGETLILCSGAFGTFPDRISDEYSIETLVRDRGSIPAPRQPSGTPPIVDDLLGTLEWDDNLNWYSGQVSLPNISFDLSLDPDEENHVSTALLRAKEIVRNLDRYLQMSGDLAVDRLLELKNDIWLEEGESEISPDEFKTKMTLEAIVVAENANAIFWHDDGGMFLGHSIEICIDANDKCTKTCI
jgi:hypothetical protein